MSKITEIQDGVVYLDWNDDPWIRLNGASYAINGASNNLGGFFIENVVRKLHEAEKIAPDQEKWIKRFKDEGVVFQRQTCQIMIRKNFLKKGLSGLRSLTIFGILNLER